jgi:Uma2 family endonuclease
MMQPAYVDAAMFHEFICRPENQGRHFELIHGEIVEKMVAHRYSARVTIRIGGVLEIWLMKNDIGFLTSPEGGYLVGDQRFMPDIGFIRYERLPDAAKDIDGYIPAAPDLAVEVISPKDNVRHVTRKIASYLAAGVVVWAVYPDDKEIEVFAPGAVPVRLTSADTLDGGALLPGFSVPVKDLFPAEGKPQSE